MIIAILAVVLVFIIIKKSPYIKGKLGEKVVSSKLGKTIPGQQYTINNLMFIDNDGTSRQIDHVYISHNGIWVIETKNYGGKIYGNSSQREWTQIMAGGKTKNKFYNPVKQNFTHVYKLSEQLDNTKILHNVVCFLRADISNISADCVYSIYQLSNIKTKMTGITLSSQEMEYYYNKLIQLKLNCNVSTNDHVKSIQQSQSNIREGVCPRCNGNLILRHGKNGDFYGCSGFPKCRFTKNI